MKVKELKRVVNLMLKNKTGVRYNPLGEEAQRLNANEWNNLLIYSDLKPKLIHRVRAGALSDWGREILDATSAGQSVLEVGSGTGEISLRLALQGRKVTLLDFSHDSLTFARQCAAELGVTVKTVEADALNPLSFQDETFDHTWSSGLLEHFTAQERRSILREQARITRGSVITLVPNAACVAYRVGKAYQEEQGIWPYGLEIPIFSLREDYEAAGLQVKSEYSVGPRHALNFLPADHQLRKGLASWMEDKSDEYLRDCHQGYLLMTNGSKTGGNKKC